MEELKICLMLGVKTDSVVKGGLMSRVVERKSRQYIYLGMLWA